MMFDLFYHQFEQVLEPIGFLKTQSDGLAETGDGIAPLSSFDISQGSPSALFYRVKLECRNGPRLRGVPAPHPILRLVRGCRGYTATEPKRQRIW
jgi:hypothetical protein